MSASAQLTSEQLKDIIQDQTEVKIDASEVLELVEDSEEVVDPDNCSLVL